MKQRGFTLVEIAIVLVIIGLILAGILGSQSIISSAKAKDAVAIVDDLRTATAYFKQRYGYLPGDLPNPANYINAVPALVQGLGTIGNGTIDGAVNGQGQASLGSEVAVAPLQLFSAGLIGKIDNSDPQRYIKTAYGAVHIVSLATANGLVPTFSASNPAARNAIVFVNLPCDVANEMDVKIDDGNLTTGKAIGSAVCLGSNPLPFFAIAL